MNNNIFTKTTISISSVTLAIILLIWNQIGNVEICKLISAGNYDCLDVFSTIQIVLLPVLPYALFSLITFNMRDEVYKAWFMFARWWVPMSMFLTYITPDENGTWGIPALFDKELTAYVFSVLFALMSLLIIVYSSIKYHYRDQRRSFRTLSIVLIIACVFIVFSPVYWFFHGLFWQTICGPLEETFRVVGLSQVCLMR